ncbi:A/G-specific adenine glycosylase [Flavicella marina]|uniref:A/G-specific adenine glycosylase n=1 Tax=Flavicella marina TaxID=1475951 RepID=UPI00126424BD|nr:A/G-specific adenine glycosylase [Flavicella marina]
MRFCNLLESWYLSINRDLPWRKNKNPYSVWLSEIILQQTRVAQGTAYYHRFLESFPTVFDLAAAHEDEVLKLWQGLGYYSRARNLHFSAKFIVNELEGKFPATYKELLQLKGVGDYTASAIASICYNEKTAVVDGNVFRVLARYFGIDTPINSAKGIKEFKILAQSLLETDHPGRYNQAIMDFGALQCTPQNPDCSVCPLVGGCEALRQQSIKQLPVKEKKIKIKKRYFNFLVVITDANQTILTQRKGKGIWENLFQFPLIESENSIELDQLIARADFQEISEETQSIELFNKQEWVHKLSHQHLYTKFWVLKSNSNHEDLLPIEKIKEFAVPRLVERFIQEYGFNDKN